MTTLAAAASAVVLSIMLILQPAAAMTGPTTAVVTPTASQGWLFNRDVTTSSPYNFTEDESSLGAGSLYVQPIDNVPDGKDKFIAEKELKVPVSDFNSVAYDFLIAGNGDESDANKFYLNVFATVVNDDKFYDCRYDYAVTSGSLTNFTTASFAKTDAPVNVRRASAASIPVCPTTLNAMPAGSYVRAISLNVGDTSMSDTGLAGYLDNVVVTTSAGSTVYDFELRAYVASTKDACKKGGWMNFQAGYKNQGQCVSSVVSSRP